MLGAACYACGLRSQRKIRPFLPLHRIDCCRWFPTLLFTSDTSFRLRRRPRNDGSVHCDAGGGGGESFFGEDGGSFWVDLHAVFRLHHLSSDVINAVVLLHRRRLRGQVSIGPPRPQLVEVLQHPLLFVGALAAGRWRATSADALELFLRWLATEKEASAAARKYSDAWRSRRNWSDEKRLGD